MLFLLLQFGPQVPIMYDVHGSTFQPFLAIGMSGGHRCWSPGIPREPWESGDGRTRSYKQAPALRNTRVHLIPAVSQVQGIWSTYWGRDPRNFSASKGRLRRSHKFWTSPSLSQSHPWSASDIPSGGRQWAITFLLALWKHFAHRCLRTEVREKKGWGSEPAMQSEFQGRCQPQEENRTHRVQRIPENRVIPDPPTVSSMCSTKPEEPLVETMVCHSSHGRLDPEQKGTQHTRGHKQTWNTWNCFPATLCPV